MPSKRDYYDILGLGKDASADEVKRAYRKAALKYHPDNYKGDKEEGETLFKEVSEAYEVLSDSDKRQRYDRFGHEGLRGAGMHDFSNMGFGDIFSMFNDIFGGMGGMGGSAGPRKRRGYDLETQVALTLEEIATGAEPTIEFDRTDICETCEGTGAKPGTEVKRCTECGGYGQVQQQVQSFFGTSVRVMPCPVCKGKGEMITDPCKDCRGTGRAKRHRKLSVQIPAGVRDGQAIRVRGEGEPGDEGAPRGDLHVYISVKPHPLLQRRGDDLICTVPIAYSLAALGGTTNVPTLSGEEEIDIPAGTQNGDVIHLKGRGLPALGSGKMGQQHVVVYIEVPKKLSKPHRELLEQLAEVDQSNVTEQRRSFFDKVKDYFSGNDRDEE